MAKQQNRRPKKQHQTKEKTKQAVTKKANLTETVTKDTLRKPIRQTKPKETFALGRENYILITIGIIIILIGFIVMGQKGGDIFSFARTGISTILVIFGFLFEIYAIMKKPKSANKPEE